MFKKYTNFCKKSLYFLWVMNILTYHLSLNKIVYQCHKHIKLCHTWYVYTQFGCVDFEFDVYFNIPSRGCSESSNQKKGILVRKGLISIVQYL